MPTTNNAMPLDARIYVAGHRGLAGSAIERRLRGQGYTRVITRSHADLELMDTTAVRHFFADERPEYVFLAAAKVGGVMANSTYPAQFIHENLMVQCNVIHEAYRASVKRLLFLGSSCIYPKACPQPMREAHLLNGELEPTNRPYAVAKIAGLEMCWAYNRQYGTDFMAAMPTNLYGPGDNYDLEASHVLPALVRKMMEARDSGAKSVEIWGSGEPRREFLHSDDMATACLLLMNLPTQKFRNFTRSETIAPIVNVGSGSDLSIRELAELIAGIVGFRGELVFDRSRPDGTRQKLMDSTMLQSLGWRPAYDLRSGITALVAELQREHGIR